MAAIIFDMDGALLRLPLDIEEVRLRLAALFAPHGVTRPFRPIVGRIRAAAAEARSPALETAGFAILDEWEVRAAAEARAREGAAATVAELARRGVRLGLLTDAGRACVVPALATAGLDPALFTVVTRNDAPSKPDPTGLRQLVTSLGDATYVADHPNDLAMALAAGVPAIGLQSGMVTEAALRKAGASAVISHLAEILPRFAP